MRLYRKEEGYTLIELVIVLAVIAIFSTVVGSVVLTAVNATRKITGVNELQRLAQTVEEQVEQALVSVDQAIGYEEQNGAVTVVLQHKNWEEMLIWDSKTKQLQYRKEQDGAIVVPTQCIAEHISNFSMDISDVVSNHIVHVQIEVEKMGKHYELKQSIYIRNKVSIMEEVQS